MTGFAEPDTVATMFRRMLQRLVRAAPRAARLAWSVLPAFARTRFAGFVHPIAAGERRGRHVLSVPSGHERTLDLVRIAGSPGDESALAAKMECRGGRVLTLEPGEPPEALARAAIVLDAAVWGASDDRFDALGWRRIRAARHSPSTAIDEAFPSVSVVVVTCANRDLCRSCLASIARNTPWPRLEVIVVDNGSTDGTREMLEAIDARFSLVVLRNDDNRGYAPATNQGIRRAKAEFVVLLNDDTVVAPGWMARLIAHLEADARLGLVGPVTNEIGNDAKVPTAYERLEEMEAFAIRRAFDHMGQRRETRMLALFCAALRRSTFDEVGLLDERYEVGLFEDDDFARRLQARGWKLAIANDAFVHHVGQASFGKLDDDTYLALWEANRRRFEQKWGTRWTPPRGSVG